MIYVYAVTDPVGEPFPELKGMDEQPAEMLLTGGIAVVVSRHPGRTFGTAPEDVCRHERVVESLMRDRAVLPARFGTTFGEEKDVCTVVGSKTEVLGAGLDKVRGCVEMGVRILSEGSVESVRREPALTPPPLTGRDWMVARLERERNGERERVAGESVVGGVHEPLSGLAREACVRLNTGRFVMTAAYLVGRERVEEFTARARALASEHRRVRVLCTGPWPPYSFAPAMGSGGRGHG